MKIRIRLSVLGNSAILILFSSNAVASHANDKLHGVCFDQSKGVYFESFSDNTFSLELLQAKHHFKNDDLVFGGALEADLQHWQGDPLATVADGIYQQGNGLYFTELTLDMMVNAKDWGSMFASLADSHIGRPGPAGNYIYVPRAFAVFGNLDKNPFYATLGINTIPFGVFASGGEWATSLASDYFEPTQAPQVSLGYYQDGWNAVVTGYRDQDNYQNHYVYSVYYNHDTETSGYSVGAGYLNDLKTDATGSADTQPEAASPTMDMGAIYDINASIHYREFVLYGEYVRGQNYLKDNNGLPQALSFVLHWTHNIADKDTIFGIGYSESLHLQDVSTSASGEDGLLEIAAGLKNAWVVSVTRPVFAKNILLGLDLETATTYSAQHTSTATLDLYVYI